MNILAIDPSLTSTGWATIRDDSESVGVIKPAPLTGVERLAFIVQSIEDILDDYATEFAVLEGYAMGVRGGGRVFDIGELGGVLKFTLWRRSIRTLVVPPTSLKLFLTGNGRADKEDMKREASRIAGRLIKNADEADAYGLLQLGKAACARRLLPRDRRHYKHRALAGCATL